MPTDSSTLEDSDNIDLAWDDEPSSPSATAEPSSATVARLSSSARSARLASTLRDAAKAAREPSSIPPRLSPPPKPTGRPRYSLRPVLVPPRPSSSSPSTEHPSALDARSEHPSALDARSEHASDLDADFDDAEPEIIEDSPPRREFPVALPAGSGDVAHATRAPAAIMQSDAAYASSIAPALSEWPDADVDSLGPSQLDALPESPVPAFRDQTPRRALLAIGIAASAGLMWLVAGALDSAPAEIAELPQARPRAAAAPTPVAHPVPAALTPKAINSAQSAEAAGTAIENETPEPIPVAVHVSPADAFIFESGRRLGRGDVTVDVAPGTKVTLVAQLKGYKARIVVLDGSYTSVNIDLRRAQASRATPPSASEVEPDKSAAAHSVAVPESAPKNENAATADPPTGSSITSSSAPDGEIDPI
jgi:hypothetical protein